MPVRSVRVHIVPQRLLQPVKSAEMKRTTPSENLNTYNMPASLMTNCKIQAVEVTKKASIDAVL